MISIASGDCAYRRRNHLMQNSRHIATEPETVSIQIAGANGDGCAVFSYEDWQGMCPAACVLAIHHQRRDLTDGKPFNILSVVRN
jgi:hypothetical protein